MKKTLLTTCCVLGATSPILAAHALAVQAQDGTDVPRTDLPVTSQTVPDARDPNDEDDSDVIIVTAQRRAENLQDVPVAISALTGDGLDRAGIDNVADIGGVIPNAQAAAALGITSVFLRGIGTNALGIGSDPSVAYHADGVYVARPRAQTAGFFDVQRLEVVRGPQGDLYGRNATGGSLNVITNKPTDEAAGFLTAAYGNYDAVRVEGAVSGPLSETGARGRLAVLVNKHDGYGENIITGGEVNSLSEWAVRGTIEFEPTERMTVELIGDYYEADDSIGGWQYLGTARDDVPLTAATFGGISAEDPRDIASTRDPARTLESYGVTGTVGYEFAENLFLKSITGYRTVDSDLLTDVSGGSELGATLTQLEDQDQFSQEVQLLADGEDWNLIVGGYFFTEDVDGNVRIPLFFFPGAQFSQVGTADTEAWAAFAHADYQLTDRLKVIGGLRYSWEEKTSEGQFTAPAVPVPTGGQESYEALTPKIAIEYTPNADLLLYASAARGFKSGGFIAGSAGAATDPEFLWSYEVGLKGSFADDRLQANLAAFYYDYTDLVVSRVVGNAVVNENAATATNLGFEAEIVAKPTDALTINASFGYLDATYEDYSTADPVNIDAGVQDLNGNRLNNAPEFTGRVGAQYEADLGAGELRASADYIYISEVFFSPFNDDVLRQGGEGTLNARLGYELANGVSITAYGRNLTDETIVQTAIVSADFLGFPALGGLNEPRTYGVEVGLSF